MARVQLLIADPTTGLTVRAMLEAEGHAVVDAQPDVLIVDDRGLAIRRASDLPVLLLTPYGDVPAAIAAMREGVYGYALLPLQPGEVGLMVSRAHRLRMAPPTLTPLDEVEMRHIEAVLRACKGNQAEAARVLGIGRNTLWRKLKKARGASLEEGSGGEG